MRLLSLELRNFRNHLEAKTALDGRNTLLLGENGSGKTNWIEAAVLLSLGRSFRGSRDREIVRKGADTFEVRGVVSGRGSVTREISARGSMSGTREVVVDGAPLPRLTDLLGTFPTVHFSVEDVSVFGGGPAARRRFLDMALCQLEPATVGSLRDYAAALKQRNRLLIESGRGPIDEDEFGVWEAILARAGLDLDRRREALARELHRRLREISTTVDESLVPLLDYVGTEQPTVEERAERLRSMRVRDRRLGWTSEGPHRARLICRIAGRELTEGASRGYSRLYSILLRLALARVLDERLDEPPVVLLDDPESELDARWIGPILALIPEGSQVIVTGCRPLSAMPAGFDAVAMESIALVGSAA